MSTNEIAPEPLSQCQQRTSELKAELAELRLRYDSLQQSESRYRQLFENAPISMVLVNTDGYLMQMNAAAEALYGLPLHQLNQQACPIFNNPQLVENGTLPYMLRALVGETVIEPPTYYDTSEGFANGKVNYGRGHYFPLWDREGHVEGLVEICPDFKDVFELQQRLFKERELAESQRHRAVRERAMLLLSTVAQVANLLLRSPDYTTVLPDVVRLLGKAVGSDRCGTGQIILHPISGKSAVRILPEWCKTGTLHSEEFSPHSDKLFLFEDDAPCIAQQLIRGEVINCLVADLPEPDRSLLAAQGNIAELFVPILANHRLWGFISFDNCSKLRLYDEAEIAILKTAAESIAAAIERQAKDEALLQLEQSRSQELQRINTELQQTLGQLEARDRVLEASAVAANTLLTTENLDKAVNRAFQILGEALDTDRIGICEITEPPSNSNFPGWRALGFEWNSPETVSQSSDVEASEGSFEDIPEIFEYLSRNESLSYLIEEMPEPFRSHQIAIGVKSTHVVPIFVGGQWWGVLGVDDCREAKHRGPAELAVLKTAAVCISSAIQRDRTQKAILQAERARSQELQRINTELQQTLGQLEARDRLLEATATATNVLLTLEDFDTAVDTALKMLVEGSGCDRINILENSFDTSPIPTYITVIYEWARPGIIRQLSALGSGQISSEGIEAFLEQHYLRGDGFGGLLDEWDEPLRSAFAAVQVKSSYSVPIRVNGQWWGALCLDYCQSATRVSPAEVAVLKTIADCIGSAIQRDRTQKAILQAEQARSQELHRINTELQQTLDRLTESEDSLNTLFDLSTVGFYFGRIDPPISITLPIEEQCEQLYQNFRVMRANQAFADMYGVADPDEVVGMGNPDCHVEASEKNQAFIRAIIESGHNFRNIETEEIDRHGQQHYFLNSGTKVSRDGYYTGGWSTQIDVTELRLTQRALLQAQQDRVAELARTNQALRNNLDRLAAEPNLDAFLGHVLTEISQQLNMHTAWLYRYDPQHQTLQLSNWVEQGTVQPTERFAELEDLAQPISIANTPIWDCLNQTKYPFVITPDNAAQFVFSGTEDWQLQWAQQHGIESGINILLSLGDRPLGLLGLLSANRSEFTSEELELAQTLSQQATLAIQLTQLAAEAQQAALFEERNRLAGEIHDTLAQTFTGISVQLELLKYLLPHNSIEVNSILDRIGSLAQTGITEARRSVWSIYPDSEDYADLAQKLADCLKNLTGGTDLHTQVEISGEPYPLSGFLGTNLLRIGQEAIANSLKHAQANELMIQLNYSPHQVSLCIKDNGIGFSAQVQTQGFGLISISERADRIGGQLRITTQPEQGTEIFVQVHL